MRRSSILSNKRYWRLQLIGGAIIFAIGVLLAVIVTCVLWLGFGVSPDPALASGLVVGLVFGAIGHIVLGRISKKELGL